MKNTKYISLAVLGSLVLAAVPAFAQTSTTTPPKTEVNEGLGRSGMMGRGIMMGRSGIAGTVSAINGTTLTVTSINKLGWGRNGADGKTPSVTPLATPAPVTYTVDATNASVIKAGVASTVPAIAVGDMVMVQGTVME